MDNTQPQVNLYGDGDDNGYNSYDDVSSSSDEEEDEDVNKKTNNKMDSKTKKSSFMSFFSTFTGKTLTPEDLEDVMEKFKQHLNSKNVADEISAKLCDSVAETLIGQKLGTF